MTDTALITGINEWLVDQALGEPDIVEMFEGLCLRLHGIGVVLEFFPWTSVPDLTACWNVVQNAGPAVGILHRGGAGQAPGRQVVHQAQEERKVRFLYPFLIQRQDI